MYDLRQAGWKLWPFAHLITYGVIPVEQRLLWVDCVELIWVTILSTYVPSAINFVALLVDHALAHVVIFVSIVISTIRYLNESIELWICCFRLLPTAKTHRFFYLRYSNEKSEVRISEASEPNPNGKSLEVIFDNHF